MQTEALPRSRRSSRSPTTSTGSCSTGRARLIRFKPGQYVDIHIPGTEDVRSFSMANTSPRSGELEFMIKIYPDGHFSVLLADERASTVGDDLEVTGPYGVVHAAASSPTGRCCSSAAVPGWRRSSRLLRALAEKGSDRQGGLLLRRAHPDDLFHLEELAELEATAAQLPLRTGAVGLRRRRRLGRRARADHRRGRAHEQELSEVDAYLCGPPPMVDAAIAMLDANGRPRGPGLLRQVHDHRARIARKRREDTHDGNRHRRARQRAQRSQAGVHRRRGRSARNSRPQPAAATTTSPRPSGGRPSTRTSPSTSSPTPSATCSRAGSTASPTAPAAIRRSGRR